MAGGSFRRAAAPGAAAAAGAPGGAAEAPQRSRSSASFGRLPDPEQLAALTKDQLKAECRRRGQKASGNKVELLSRLGYFKVRGTLAASGEWCGAAAASAATVGHTAPDHAHRNGTPANHANSRARNNTSSGPLTPQMIEMETSLVLWRKPFLTSEYFLKEVAIQLQQGFRRSSLNSSWIPLSEQDFDINGTNLISQYKNAVSLLGAVLAVIVASHFIEGPHKPFMELALRMGLWWSWWVILGVLSSVGLGTGLHTFLLYLGPHIAKVTMAAYECNTLNFPEPPYPNEIICPSIQDATWEVSIWNIMSKVRVEAMLWGCGTALGELPPYFMARAARLSQNHSRNQPTPTLGEDKDDENHILNRAKIWIEQLVAKVGFLGILACASIPNPLFDLAGLTCGHFLVPFWTFFGATLIGKAIIKMHIQKMFVIIAFNESLIGRALYWVQEIPWMGPWMEAPLLEFLRGQKEALHRKGPSEPLPERGSFLAGLLEKLVLAMVAFFVVSIVNSLAQSYQKRASARGRKGKRLRD